MEKENNTVHLDEVWDDIGFKVLK